MSHLVAGPELQGLRNCVQCGVASPRLSQKSAAYSAARWWLTYQCGTCAKLVFVVTDDRVPHNTWIGQDIEEIWPKQTEVASEFPDKVKRYLTQAIESIGAPDGSVMLSGSAVDAMLKNKGLTYGSVYKRIEQAVESGILTSDMGEWAHAVRLGANNPRHADTEDPHMTTEEAKRSVEFARMLGHILFTLPAEVERGKAKAQAVPDEE